jgi:SSS family transporter
MANAIMVTNVHIADYILIAIFLLFIVFWGSLFIRKEKNASDYLLGGRSMPWFAVAISMIMALFSAISFVAIPGEAFSKGIRMWLAGVITAAFTPLGIWLFLRFYYKLGSFTPYEYLEKRFSSSIRLMAGVLFLLTRGLYLAVVLYATAKAFLGAFGWNATFSILLIGFLGTLYTTLGGAKAVIWTDVVQFIVLVGGILTAAILLTVKVNGGFVEIFNFAFQNDRGFNFSESFFSFNPYERVTFWWLILSGISATLGYYATDQLTIQKLLSVKTYEQAKRAAYTNIPMTIGLISIFWYIGLALFCYYSQKTNLLPKDMTGDNVFAFFITNELRTPIPGLMMAGLLAATMTTLNSGMNALSAVFMKDVYTRFFNKSLGEKAELLGTRVATGCAGVFMVLSAVYITWLSDNAGSTVMESIGIWQSMNGIVLAVFILGVINRRVNTSSIIFAMIAGAIALVFAVSILYYASPSDHRVSFIIVGNVGLIVTLIYGFIASFFGKRPLSEKVEGLTLFTVTKSD